MQTLHAPFKLVTFANEWAALPLIEVLEARGIPFFLKRFEDRAYGSLWQTQQGWGTLWVESRDVEGVMLIYRQILDSEPIYPEHDAAPVSDQGTETQTPNSPGDSGGHGCY
jgi:hypothetical protein